jgi:hypothetical protein
MTELHPAGEDDFMFTTAGGKVDLRTTDDALTPYGGLVPWAAFTRHTGIVEKLAATCPVTRTNSNAPPVHDILHRFLLTALVDGRRFAHVERLREDPTVTEWNVSTLRVAPKQRRTSGCFWGEKMGFASGRHTPKPNSAIPVITHSRWRLLSAPIDQTKTK